MFFSDNHIAVLKAIQDDGAVTLKHGREIYRHDWSFYRAMNELEDRGIVERREAPDASKYDHVWTMAKGKEGILRMLENTRTVS